MRMIILMDECHIDGVCGNGAKLQCFVTNSERKWVNGDRNEWNGNG